MVIYEKHRIQIGVMGQRHIKFSLIPILKKYRVIKKSLDIFIKTMFYVKLFYAYENFTRKNLIGFIARTSYHESQVKLLDIMGICTLLEQNKIEPSCF
ncbi:hypothetical protein C0J52_09589 [Blattella germanica]|nr:hypothetical protein C0J52_09589 [Blattella germanica]